MISAAAQVAAELAWDHFVFAQSLDLTRREETRHAHGLIIGAAMASTDQPDDGAFLMWVRDAMSGMEQHNHQARRSACQSTGSKCA